MGRAAAAVTTLGPVPTMGPAAAVMTTAGTTTGPAAAVMTTGAATTDPGQRPSAVREGGITEWRSFEGRSS
jgi:hypothetical protein